MSELICFSLQVGINLFIYILDHELIESIRYIYIIIYILIKMFSYKNFDIIIVRNIYYFLLNYLSSIMQNSDILSANIFPGMY